MDFDKLMRSYHHSGKANQIPKWIKIFGFATVATATVFTVAYFYPRPSSNAKTQSPSQSATTVDTTATVTTSIPLSNSKKRDDTGSLPTPTIHPQSPKLKTKDSLQIEKQTTSRLTEATPVDGYPSLYAYFDKELKYPTNPNDSIQGIVTVSFAVTKEGKVDLIKIENSLGPAFDAECIRVIQNMPNWKPATIDGKPVQTRLSIPLSFKVKK
jgi:TonB family protein